MRLEIQVLLQLRETALAVFHAQVVDLLELLGVSFCAVDVDGLRGAEDEGFALLFPLGKKLQRVVIGFVAVEELPGDLGVGALQQLQGKPGHGGFPVGGVLGQDYHQLVIALAVHPLIRDTVPDAPVQVFPAVNFYRAGHEGHGAGGPEGVHLGKGALDSDVFRLPGGGVCDHGIKGDAGGLEGLVVEGVQLPGHPLIGIVGADEVSLPEKGPQAHIVFVSVEPLVIADDPAFLPG